MPIRISIKQAQQQLGCSRSHLLRLIKAKHLDAIDIGLATSSRTVWSISQASVTKFLKSRTEAERG